MPPEIQLEGVGLKFFRGNELRAIARAQHATFLRNTGDGTAQSVRMRLLPASGRGEIEIVAREIQGNVRRQEATAQGGVRLAETGGAAGVTEVARLFSHERRVTGDRPVDLVAGGSRIHAAAGFSLDISTPGALALEGPIDTTIGVLP
ncbi:MAG: hypothetical protein HY901_17890 [Deltaproteobacteria bacterium]|nr:hypothetical protein [Deltaproteobacteria bacterium]